MVFTLVGVGAILFGIGALVQLIESARLGATGERVAGVLMIIAGLILLGGAVLAEIYARRIEDASAEARDVG